MRKYFLTTAVALLATSTANATTDYAEVTAKATIEVAGTFSCDDFDFGTIVVKQNNEAFTMSEGEGDSPDLLSSEGSWVFMCYGEDLSASKLGGYNLVHRITLKNDNGDTLSASAYVEDCDDLGDGYGCYYLPQLNIPAHVKAGEYTGSFTITATY